MLSKLHIQVTINADIMIIRATNSFLLLGYLNGFAIFLLSLVKKNSYLLLIDDDRIKMVDRE